MKYYDEEEMHPIRTELEEEILSWEGVGTKKMFGCPCYMAGGKLFAFIVTGGVVITQCSEDDRTALSKRYETSPFSAGRKIVHKWVKVPVKSGSDVNMILPFVRKSYKLADRPDSHEQGV